MSTWAVPESVWQWKKMQSLSTTLGLLWLPDDNLPQQKHVVFLQHTPAKYYFHVFNGFDIIIKIFSIIRTFAQVFFSTSCLFIYFLLDQNARLRNTELCDLCKVMTTHAFLYYLWLRGWAWIATIRLTFVKMQNHANGALLNYQPKEMVAQWIWSTVEQEKPVLVT